MVALTKRQEARGIALAAAQEAGRFYDQTNELPSTHPLRRQHTGLLKFRLERVIVDVNHGLISQEEANTSITLGRLLYQRRKLQDQGLI